MAKIIKFPGATALDAAADTPSAVLGRPPDEPAPDRPRPSKTRTANRVHAVIWVLVAITSPVWTRLTVIDLFYQICRTVYHWQTSGMHPGWTLFLHALGAAFLCIFFVREPREMR